MAARRRISPALALALATWLPLATGACGYRLVRSEDLPWRRVSVETLDNDSTEPGVELVVSEALRKELLRRGSFRLVDPGEADVVVGGRVQPVRTRGQSLSSVSLALEYTVTLALDVELREPGGEARSLPAAALSESEIYLASANAEATRKNRQEALRRLSEVLAGRVADALYTGGAP